jgi:hypothetical protein
MGFFLRRIACAFALLVVPACLIQDADHDEKPGSHETVQIGGCEPECPEGKHCDDTYGCVDCTEDEHCAPDSTCKYGTCWKRCDEDTECPGAECSLSSCTAAVGTPCDEDKTLQTCGSAKCINVSAANLTVSPYCSRTCFKAEDCPAPYVCHMAKYECRAP